MKEQMCDCCKEEPARHADCRYKKGKQLYYRVCQKCLLKNNERFWKLMEEKEGKDYGRFHS